MNTKAKEKNIENKTGVTYKEKIKPQKKVVKDLEDLYNQSASDDLRYKLRRETDLLRHYTNAAHGNPGRRAKKTAEKAGKIILRKVIQ